jgi:hypothetical protein
MVHPFSQNPRPNHKPQKSEKNAKIAKKKKASLQSIRLWAAVTCQPRVGALNYFLPKFSSYPHIFAHMVNSCWLALAQARPAQTSPKSFKHP